MASSMIFPLAISIVFFIVLLSTPAAYSAKEPTNTLIGKICGKASVPKYCTTTLYNNLQFPTTDFNDISKTLLDKSSSTAGYTFGDIQGFIKNTTGAEKAALVKCGTDYGVIVGKLKEATGYLLERDYGKLVAAEKAVAAAEERCSENFQKPPYPKNQIEFGNYVVKSYVEYSLIAADFLVKE